MYLNRWGALFARFSQFPAADDDPGAASLDGILQARPRIRCGVEQWFAVFFVKGSVLMGLLLRGVSKSSGPFFAVQPLTKILLSVILNITDSNIFVKQ
jgi:hypothetical protein